LLPADEFIEVHVATSLAVCEQRDPKGLYRKARAGQIPNFTGIDSAYEAPLDPELVIDTGADELDGCVQNLLAYLERRGIF
jgi:adenylylsulfate kinase-like enzyme